MKTEHNISKPVPLRCPNPADLGAQPAWTDACQVEAENVGNRQGPQDELPEITQQPGNVGKRKTPADLLEVIPGESPIQQAQLFEAARVAGINEKYARQFLGSLIAEKRIVVQKIPREKTKSALGFIRAPAQPESQDAAEELSRRP
jgi:hypothetical protein